MSNMRIEVGKYYKTQEGKKVFVGYKINKGARFPFCGHIELETGEYVERVMWGEDGVTSSGYVYNIVEEWKEPKSGVAYVNVYDDHHNRFGILTIDRAMSDEFNTGRNRIACVRVEWKEGQFDD